MKERPILFKGEMVRAILDGRKTQTRRIVKPLWLGDYLDELDAGSGIWCERNNRFPEEIARQNVCRYGVPGDRLWVRETFCQKVDDAGYFVWTPDGDLDPSCFHYAADGYEVLKADGDGGFEERRDGSMASPWKPSIHMPRWASRITLEITGVRVERLQDISEEDARAEGVRLARDQTFLVPETQYNSETYKDVFSALWTNINGAGSWAANPWVWVVEFKRVTA